MNVVTPTSFRHEWGMSVINARLSRIAVLAVVLACLSVIRVEAYPDEVAVSMAVDEIISDARFDTDCNVRTMERFDSEMALGAPLDLESVPGGDEVFLVVYTVEQALQMCYRFRPCMSVQLYSLDSGFGLPLGLLFVQYFGVSEPPSANSTSSPPLGYDAWVAGGSVQRDIDVSCDDDTLDAEWFVRTWGGRFVTTDAVPDLYDSVFPSGVITPPTPDDIARKRVSVEAFFNTKGHVFHLWPNPTCRLTPQPKDPASSCTFSRCPVHSLCPMTHPVLVRTLNTCLDPGTLNITDAVVDAVLDVPPGATTFADTTRFAVGNFYFDARNTTASPGSGGYQPCSGSAPCIHSPVGGVGGRACTCEAGRYVDGDLACEMETEFWCGGGCENAGTCAFRLDLDAMTRDEMYDALVGVVTAGENGLREVASCDCVSPFTGYNCNITYCHHPAKATDCHAEGTGVCTADRFGIYGCSCVFPYYGADCEREDTAFEAPLVGDTAGAFGEVLQYSCYVGPWEVEGLTSTDSSAASLLECSGRGKCTSAGACVCNIGWDGPRCEFRACDHADTCGAFGACVWSRTDAGRARTTCECVRTGTDVTDVALAKISPSTGRCDLSLCRSGVLQVSFYPGPSDRFTVPLGVCVCSNFTYTYDHEYTGWRTGLLSDDELDTVPFFQVVGTEGNLTRVVFLDAEPRHPFLQPLLLDSVSPFAEENGTGLALLDTTPVVPVVSVASRGTFCEIPSCPQYFHPLTLEASDNVCGVEEGLEELLCAPCALNPFVGTCVFTRSMGGTCDCEGLLLDGEIPYYMNPALPKQRYVAGAERDNFMCSPYCKNGGRWVITTAGGSCACNDPAWKGPRCEDATCPHGTYTPPVEGGLYSCGTCDTGWAGQWCDTCAPGFAAPNCLECDTGFAKVGDECVSCDAAAECPPARSSGAACAGGVGVPMCVCRSDLGFTSVGSPCHNCTFACDQCLPGFSRRVITAGSLSAVRCVPCDEQLRCDPVTTAQAVCGVEGVQDGCRCISPLFTQASGCVECVDGYMRVGDSCVPCAASNACLDSGTVFSDCATATCSCKPHHIGELCDDCEPGFYMTDAMECEECVADCGIHGTPICSSPDDVRCACSGGFGGVACSECLGCGRGGVCGGSGNSTGHWCVCQAPYVHSSDALDAPCSACDPSTHFFHSGYDTCVPYAVCGHGVDVARMSEMGHSGIDVDECVCLQSHTLDPMTGVECGACAAGHAGAGCLACYPTCEYPHTCVWDDDVATATCRCASGFGGVNCATCLSGFVGPDCAVCPLCENGGSCAWNGTSAVCVCQGYWSGETCSDCPDDHSPLTCQQCPSTCHEATTMCAEDADTGRVFCECRPGMVRVAGFEDDLAHPCFPVVEAERLRVIPAEDVGRIISVLVGSSDLSLADVVFSSTPAPVSLWTYVGLAVFVFLGGGLMFFAVLKLMLKCRELYNTRQLFKFSRVVGRSDM